MKIHVTTGPLLSCGLAVVEGSDLVVFCVAVGVVESVVTSELVEVLGVAVVSERLVLVGDEVTVCESVGVKVAVLRVLVEAEVAGEVLDPVVNDVSVVMD